MKTLLLIITIFTALSSSAQIQYPNATYWNNNSIYNPAYTGIEYKHQFTTYGSLIGGRYGIYNKDIANNNIMGLYNLRLDKINSGFGINYQNNNVGLFKRNSVKASYSYFFKLKNEAILSAGVSMGYTSSKYIGEGDKIGFLFDKEGYLGDLGIVYKTERLDIGFSFNSSFYGSLDRINDLYQFNLNGSYKFDVGDFTITPGVYAVYVFKDVDYINLNLRVSYKNKIEIGGAFNVSNYAKRSFFFGYNISDKFKISYSYSQDDYNRVFFQDEKIVKNIHELMFSVMIK